VAPRPGPAPAGNAVSTTAGRRDPGNFCTRDPVLHRDLALLGGWQGYWVYGPQDPRGRLLVDLGFTLPEGLDEVTGTEFGANISRERTDLLDTDALVWLVDKYDTDKTKAQADPLYAKLRVKTEGRDIYLENEELLGGATSFITVLSLPFLLEGLVPQLAAAVDGDPATPVVRATSAPRTS
jgi:iron complex transport system substrate-binding protein